MRLTTVILALWAVSLLAYERNPNNLQGFITLLTVVIPSAVGAVRVLFPTREAR